MVFLATLLGGGDGQVTPRHKVDVLGAGNTAAGHQQVAPGLHHNTVTAKIAADGVLRPHFIVSGERAASQQAAAALMAVFRQVP